MHIPTLWRAALLQLVIIVVLFGALRLALDKEFFEDWGWLTGPIAWMGSSAIVAKALKLPLGPTLTGAVGAGLVSGVFVLIGLHIVGPIVAIPLFALWCARLRDDPQLPAEAI
ncbi:MAG TPA: hypothetical protein VNT22_06030 [Baekduia sp.]|nr:hypothetical protein [Baekduia sp.]